MKHKIQFKPKAAFTPISIEAYVERHLQSNPDEKREEIASRLKSALRDHQRGVKCACSNPIWVIGSAVMGNACFTCITGEAHPDDDYEIDQALEAAAEQTEIKRRGSDGLSGNRDESL